MTRHGKTRQDKTRQDKELYNTHDSHKNPKSWNSYVVHLIMNLITVPTFWIFCESHEDCTLRQSKEDKTRQDKTRQDKTRQDKTRQDKTRQDKTRQDKNTQDKTRQNNYTTWNTTLLYCCCPRLRCGL